MICCRTCFSDLWRMQCYPKGCAAPGQVQCQCNTRGSLSKLKRTPPQAKINVTSKSPVGDISVVTLIRTDTTLDHSQKAEKVCPLPGEEVVANEYAGGHCMDDPAPFIPFPFRPVFFSRQYPFLDSFPFSIVSLFRSYPFLDRIPFSIVSLLDSIPFSIVSLYR